MLYAKMTNDFHISSHKGNIYHFIKDELYTAKEMDRIRTKFDLPSDSFKWVTIPSSHTGYFFGARIQTKA